MKLPVDDIYLSLQQSLADYTCTVLQAPPGAGKSTRLPLLLLQENIYNSHNQIILIEPRRVAAKQIAKYLADQLGEKLGQTVGYIMRGERHVSKQTILTVVTDGIFVRMLQSDPELKNIGLVIFDEFHERALNVDLGLALALEAQLLNESLTLLIMSATIDVKTLAEPLAANIITAQSRQFPIDVKYIPSQTIPSIDDIFKAVCMAWQQQESSILVFLPGIKEISILLQRLSEQNLPNCLILPLHGGLSIEQQVQAIQVPKGGNRKIVLATNIAQTSLTIEGVDTVVDSGIERVVNWNNRYQQDVLTQQLISQASATQRAGRAGRLKAGVCYRLGDKQHFERRRAFDIAEIERVELSELLLEISLWGSQFNDLYWQSTPKPSLLESAADKLCRLHYWRKENGQIRLTELAHQYAKYGVGLRHSRILAFADSQRSNAIYKAALLLISSLENSAKLSGNVINLVKNDIKTNKPLVKSRARQLANRMGLEQFECKEASEAALLNCLCVGFSDRVAMKQGQQWKLADGSGAQFPQAEVEPNSQFIIVTHANISQYGQYVSGYAPLTALEMQTYLANEIAVNEVVVWNENKQAPQRLKRKVIGKLVLSEQTLPLNMTKDDWAKVWTDYILSHGWDSWQDNKLDEFLAKLALINQFELNEDIPVWSKQSLLQELTEPEHWLLPYLVNVKSVKQLQSLSVANCLIQRLDWQKQQRIEILCPSDFISPTGSKKPIDYLCNPPKVSVKLQEMFGQTQSPTICNGKVKLQVELLSPAQRPLQITQDLGHFWQNAYLEVKKEMKGRYPKHPWPDNPLTAIATTKTKRQLN